MSDDIATYDITVRVGSTLADKTYKVTAGSKSDSKTGNDGELDFSLSGVEDGASVEVTDGGLTRPSDRRVSAAFTSFYISMRL